MSTICRQSGMIGSARAASNSESNFLCSTARDSSAAKARAILGQNPEGCAQSHTEAKRAHSSPTASICRIKRSWNEQIKEPRSVL